MRPLPLLCAVALVAAFAGCSARGDPDPFAYMRKPLYVGGFDLAKVRGVEDDQQFWVTDGSIAQVRVLVWVNATAGGATVVVEDPAGNVAMRTTQTTEGSFRLDLGAWTVRVLGTPDAAGDVAVLAVRG